MSDTLRRSFVLLALGAAAMAVLLAFLPAAGHDQLWFLLMARRWLDGATLYGPAIFDANPPFVVWLSALPVQAAAIVHLPETTVAKLLVVLAASAVAALSGRVLCRTHSGGNRSEGPALVFSFITLFFVVPARDLGQRDALAGLLALPYVLAAAVPPGAFTPLFRTFVGFVAALGFCLKPQDALIAIAVELYLLIHNGRRAASFSAAVRSLARPEPAIVAIFGLLYLLAIHRWAPLYFSSALPILRSTYWAIGGLSVPALLWQGIELLCLAAVTLWLILRYGPPTPAVKALLAGGSGAFLAYVLQGTGWYYQQLPAISLFGAALVLHLLELQRRQSLQPPRWCVPATGALCVLAVLLTAAFSGLPFTPDRAFAITSPDPAFFRELPAGAPIAILTTSVDEAMMPVARYRLTWAQRTNNLWLLPAILRSETATSTHASSRLTPLTLARLDGLQHRWMVEDLNRWRPALILVERCQDPHIACQVLEDRHDDLLAWFQRDPAFRAVWQEYRFAGTRDRFDAYVLRPAPKATMSSR